MLVMTWAQRDNDILGRGKGEMLQFETDHGGSPQSPHRDDVRTQAQSPHRDDLSTQAQLPHRDDLKIQDDRLSLTGVFLCVNVSIYAVSAKGIPEAALLVTTTKWLPCGKL